MPDVVTFDPVNLLIVEIAAGGDNTLDMDEIYSEWKEWMKLGDNAKHLLAFRFVGGDPITANQELGSTYFIKNGWRFRPAELSHKLTLVGNVFTEPFGDSVFVDTLGAFTVNAETRVSNLTDSVISRLDLNQLLQAIYIDADNGLDTNDGTPTSPVKTVGAARTLADAASLREYRFRGTITLDEDHVNWTFGGLGAEANDLVNLAGFDVSGSSFVECEIDGTMVAPTTAVDVIRGRVKQVTNFRGNIEESALTDDLFLAPGETVLYHCYSAAPGAIILNIDLQGNAVDLFVRGFTGVFQLANATNALGLISVSLASGVVILSSTVTAGSANVHGVGSVIDNSGAGITVDTVGLIDSADVKLIKQMLAGKAVVSLDDLTVEVFDTDGVTSLVTFSISVDGRVRTRLT